MRATPVLGPIAIALATLAAAPAVPARQALLAQQPAPPVAFVDVAVVPMDRERVLTGQTVVVQDGRITALGPSGNTAVPAGATRVDGRGRYLMPGLAEMHGHVPAANPNAVLTPENVLFLYIAGGATTVRGMQGHPSHLPLRERVERGEIVGPRLYLSSPPLAGGGANGTNDVATAVARVRDAKRVGYDHLKVHEGLTAEVYDAIARTAREEGLPWGGHVSEFVGVRGALAARQSTIDHLDDYVPALEGDERRIGELARATREAGVAVVPTMPLWEIVLGLHSPESMNDRAELRYVPPQMRQAWANQVGQIHAGADAAAGRREADLRNRLLEALADEGALVLLGSDAPQLYSVPGFSLQREMETMVAAGMTPFQVLQSGTANVGRYYGNERQIGTVAVGANADLLLLEGNPLEDVRNVARKAGVMVRGRWLPWAEIQPRLDQIAQEYR